ncbi:hypothetical protein ACKE5C_11200 [Aneurinibacillus thermoaerophilus]|uniref:Uncharacterized protein n=1 Tax=Aneurinibacillus thermoaerophilus TaxID=143495 RepID=A0ABX8Y7T4_ANETH|nr:MULTISPECIES: hypothetical protein [Aneurinibacillus]AMA72759.1 hypothetical protein ACH33_07765 [Aneurinibacillus sp. XH2]QYY41480.1 hypothetical protein K3F53_11065 [Aneurinibacillus thermoaerophilus]
MNKGFIEKVKSYTSLGVMIFILLIVVVWCLKITIGLNTTGVKDFLDIILKVVQILFYIVGAIVGVLTYRSAKKGFLNTVNTEYKKRVMDHLEKLSDSLYNEFNPNSENYWVRLDPEKEIISKILEVYKKNEQKILNSKNFRIGIPHTKSQAVLEEILNRVKSDPFIPEEISNEVVRYLEKRLNSMHIIFIEESRKYMEELAQGLYKDKIKDSEIYIKNKINKRLYKEGCGISQIEKEVHNIRIKIKKYLESYNPFNKNNF